SRIPHSLPPSHREPGQPATSARGGQGRAADQGAGAVRVRDERAGPREPRVPAPQRQADGERAGRPGPLHKQGLQRQPGQAAGHHRRHLRAHPARPRPQRRPVRGHLQLLLRRLRPHLGAGRVPDLRGVVPGRHGRLRRLRGRLRPGQAPPDRLPLQDLLHLLPPGHPGPAQGPALHARPALPHRRAHARRQGRRAARLRQQLHQLTDQLQPRNHLCLPCL
ncbi:Allene oxide cyclase 3 chloroplastic, partial [Zea mays]